MVLKLEDKTDSDDVETRHDRKYDSELERAIIDSCTHEALLGGKIWHDPEDGDKPLYTAECIRCHNTRAVTDNYELVGRASPYWDVDGKVYNANLYRRLK